MPIPWTGEFTRSDVNPGQGLNRFANVRYNKPGSIQRADWAKQFGARTYGNVPAGTIMQFPDKVSGGAAWFHLLSSNYTGMTLQQMARKYTGIGQGAVGGGTPENDLQQYINTISNATGLKPTDTITPDVFSGPKGIAWVKAQTAAEGPSQKGWGAIL